jgi:hypothetical protein
LARAGCNTADDHEHFLRVSFVFCIDWRLAAAAVQMTARACQAVAAAIWFCPAVRCSSTNLHTGTPNITSLLLLLLQEVQP